MDRQEQIEKLAAWLGLQQDGNLWLNSAGKVYNPEPECPAFSGHFDPFTYHVDAESLRTRLREVAFNYSESYSHTEEPERRHFAYVRQCYHPSGRDPEGSARSVNANNALCLAILRAIDADCSHA